jgi:beta-lactamase superfamily II metal-dependent hydrolase
MQKYCNKNSKFIYNNISDSAINSISKEVTWKTVTYKNNVLNMANTIGMTSTSPNANTTFTLDDNTSFKICKIGSTSGLTDYNGYSLAIVFIYKGRRILLGGDINPTTQNQLISAIGQCDIVKDPHHGYNSKLDLDFCRNVNPKDVIVTRNHDWGTDYYRACNSVGMWQSYEKNIYALFHTNNHIVIDFIGNDYVISTSNKFYFEKCWHKFNNDNNCWCYFKQGGQCTKNETLVLDNQKRYDFNGNGFCTNPYNPY